VDWQINTARGDHLSITRSHSNHLIFINEQAVIYSENFGNKLFTLEEFQEDIIPRIADSFKELLRLPYKFRPRKKIIINEVDDGQAKDSVLASKFLESGYELDGSNLVLWPSGI
jgi:hypothetical protein